MEENKEIPVEVPNPQMFSIIRVNDETGISGQGRVLDGVVFHNGKVAICWRTDTPDSKSLHGHSSITVFDSFKAFKAIHIDSHPDNKTEIKWWNSKLNKKKRKKGN